MGTWESSGTLENLEFYCRGQNTLPWCLIYIVEKVLKCRYRKWSWMCHSDICNTSYGRKKGRKSNWQFDSRPLKVKNQSDPSVCRWSATHCWKDLEDRYKFALDLIPIKGLSKELWIPKVLGVQIGTVLGLLLAISGKKCHSDVGVAGKCKEYYMGEGGGFPRVRTVLSHANIGSHVACPSTESAPKCELTNLLVGLMQVRVTK
jgi:hypothetical protein